MKTILIFTAISLSGYGDIQLAYHDHGPNQNREGGAEPDNRLVFDTTRFVLELEGELPHDIEWVAELEVEHGGTGAALELEYEEFGEFESEIEKGGEVVLEELYVAKTFAERLTVRAGRFYVAVGQLAYWYKPTDYLAGTRPESEATVIPAVWDEIGVDAELRLGWGRVVAQVVNGLDSTGFSSQYWVMGGHQRRFELVRATDLAVVGRVDVTALPHVELGASAYFGGSTRNRPKPDLMEACGEPPCPTIDAPVLVVDGHARFTAGPVRGSALVLWGHLGNADDVSARNDRLSNELGVLRTPVADEAYAAWAELGVNVAPWLCLGAEHRLEPYGRLERYDTMFHTRDGLFDNPRFERTVATGGVGYTLADAWVAKLDVSHRSFGSGAIADEVTVRLSTGFVY